MNTSGSAQKKCVVIGAGFAGLSAAATLARDGYRVTVLEKNGGPGGRARVMRKDGFSFDMGPSWYWMPDVIESFFNGFGRSTSDYFELVRLNPSYQLILPGHETLPVPADYGDLKAMFERREPGSGARLDAFLGEARRKYETAMGEFVYRPFVRKRELLGINWARAMVRMDLFRSVASHARRYFSDPALLQLVEFPSLFLGAEPAGTPALYTLMNYADMRLGTWYPLGGMGRLVDAMERLAAEQGVSFRYNEPVTRILTENGRVRAVRTESGEWPADAVVAASDYHHVETGLLDDSARSYAERYWDSRTMAPSCLLFFLGVGDRISRLLHHNLFFDEDFAGHAESIYRSRSWPSRPLFYACAPSRTDASVAPEGMENLFILIPVAAGLKDTPDIRERYFDIVARRLEAFAGQPIRTRLVSRQDYGGTRFAEDYNAYRGNAYGLANTLRQTAVWKPSMRSRKVSNLYYAGQLTVPGPGVPPAIISGQVAAALLRQSA